SFQAGDLIVEIGSDAAESSASRIRLKPDATAETVKTLERLLASTPNRRSAAHEELARRDQRDPIDIRPVPARGDPGPPAITYIPAVAWSNTLRLASVTGDASLAQKVREQTDRWVRGGEPLFGNRIQLTSVAGTMIFAELGGEAMARAMEGARLAAARK